MASTGCRAKRSAEIRRILQIAEFETGEDISVNIDLMTMSGSLVQDLFQGNVFSNTPMTLEISTGNLDAGMYQIRLNSRDFVVTKKLLVTN